MSNPFQIIDESITLDIDFSLQQILSKVDFRIKLLPNSSNQKTLTLELSAMQINIDKILISNSNFVKLVNFTSPSLQNQANFLSDLLPEPLSFDFYVSYLNRIETQRLPSPDKISINLTIDSEKVQDEHTFTLSIFYRVIKPISGLIFIRTPRETGSDDFLYSQNYHHSSRCWAPCFSEHFQEELMISSITIIVPSGFTPLCSGSLSHILEPEDKSKKGYVYILNIKTSLEKIGLCVGNFTHVAKENDFYVFCSKSLSNGKETINETLKVYDEMLLFMDTFSKSGFFKKSFYKFVYLPNLSSHFSENQMPLSFSGMCFCDEEYMISVKNRETALRNKREIFYLISWSLISEIRVQSLLQDKWILFGFHGFLADQFRGTNENEQKIYLSNVFSSFSRLVAQGKEVFPISCDPQSRCFSDHELDEAVRLKSRLVFHMITSIANCKKQIAKTLFAKQNINTDYFLKTIKINFGIKKLKYFVKQFVKSTGIPKLEVSYSYSRKEKKIYFTFLQSPLQENSLLNRQKSRVLLEEKKFGKACEELAFFEKEQKIGGPDIMKSWRFFYGKLHVIVCETNEIDYKEESHQIFLDKKPESKAMINCRAQFKKTVNKKIGDNDDELGAGTSIMDYGYNAAASSLYESKKKMSIFTFNNSARNPMLWIKIDSENEFFHEISIKYESEAVLLMQLTKEKDAGAIYNLLKALQNFPNLTTVNTLCSLLETKESDIYIKLLMIQCLLGLSSAGTGWRSLDMLMNILRKNCLESDGSLKPNNFTRLDEYLVNKTIIHGIATLKDEKNEDQQHFMGFGTLNFLLKLLKENDNSKNEFGDALYKRELIRAILKSNNPKCVGDILTEVYRCLEEEIASPSEKYEVVRTILRYFGQFLQNNGLNKKLAKKAENLPKDNIFDIILKIKSKLKFLKSHALVDYFNFKLHFTDKFMMFLPWEFLIYGLKKLEKYRTGKKMILSIFEGMLLVFVKYVEKSGEKFGMELQTTLSLYNNYQIASIIWEQMTSGISLICPKIRVILLFL